MIGHWNRLTPLVALLLLSGVVACEETSDAADGGSYSNAPYELCDGSDRIRLGYQSGGGFVEESYFFEQPYGTDFLFIDGQCDFIIAGHKGTPGTFSAGHLDAQTAGELEHTLGLDQLPKGEFADKESCPDAGTVSLATAQFYGDCSCGCDPGTPAALERAFEAVTPALTQLRAQGAAHSGDVEVAAVARNFGSARAWPFSWPIGEIANERLNDSTMPRKERVLEGADAQTARDLRSEAYAEDGEKRIQVQSGGGLYELLVRDRVPPAFAAEITRFETRN
jgi:hypothetical protein